MSGDEITPIKRKTCPCGWLPPRDMTMIGVMPTGEFRIRFTCPSCGRVLERIGGKMTFTEDKE